MKDAQGKEIDESDLVVWARGNSYSRGVTMVVGYIVKVGRTKVTVRSLDTGETGVGYPYRMVAVTLV